MSGHAPDATSLFNLVSPAATDDELKSLLASAAGKNFRVSSQHFLSKAAVDTAIVVGFAAGTDVLVDWGMTDWLFGRVVDITALSGIQANWVFRPAFLGQVMMDLQNAGGLQAAKAADEGELASLVVAAAKTMPLIKAQPADVLVLDDTATGHWIDHALTANFTSEDGTARAYMQFRSTLGFWRSPGDLGLQVPVIQQIPYTTSLTTS